MDKDFVVPDELWKCRETEGIDYQLNILYQNRIKMLKERILASAEEQYGNDIKFSDFFSLREGESGLLYGVIQLKMENRKSFIVNLEVDEDILLPNEDNRFGEKIKKSDKDCLNLVVKDYVLKLENIDIYKYCHGAVVGVYGSKMGDTQSFLVKDVIYPKPALQKERIKTDKETLICFISDLRFSKDQDSEKENSLGFLLGQFQGGSTDLLEPFKDTFQNVERIVVAGGSFDDSEFFKRSYNILDLKEPLISHEQITEADKYFESLTKFAPVHVMPGICDVGSGSWPVQAPFRRVYQRCNKLINNFFLTTNPVFFESNGVVFLGISGESVADILKTRTDAHCLDVMEDLLKCQHLSPSAPDNMSVFVNKTTDHMVLNRTPHVFFCGGQSKHERRKIKLGNYEVLLITLPSFSTTNTVLFFNTKTLETFDSTLNMCT